MEDLIKVEVVAGVVLRQDDKYLLLQEAQPKAYGLWNLPAGKVEVGESLEQAAIREAKEETNLDVELLKEIGIFHENATAVIKHAFTAVIKGGQFRFAPDEFLNGRWFSYTEIQEMQDKLRGPWVFKAIKIVEDNG